MPLRSIFQLGAALGTLYLLFGARRRRIARRNIELCFNDLSSKERSKLLKENFKESGIGLLESLIPWLHPDRALKNHFEITKYFIVSFPKSGDKIAHLAGV